ncbi:MAG TPA: hypothetical protein VE959_05575 [Bryobacteraceae bacterium]|nr:hypothetical protein [Bryobacteraceae bacterium]
MKSLALIALSLLPALALAQRSRERDWKFEDRETIRQTYNVASGSGPAKLLVDNVSGFVHVTGAAGNEVQVSVERHTRAESNEALASAKREVKLDQSQQGNSVRLYVDGPFRGNNGVNYRGDQYYGYRVTFDYDIQVPAATELVLKTINDGDIVVKRTSGPFEIGGLNGGIEMEEISGYGSAHTLNGPLKVSFSRNPAKDSEFHTLNGAVDINFQPGLDANLHFHTLNGGVYADFELTALPARGGENTNGKFIYRSDRRAMDGRAGKGGPELTFHTLNGPIRLRSKGI